MTSQKTKIVENLKVFENVQQIITKKMSLALQEVSDRRLRI